MQLGELLFVVNYDTMVTCLDNETGEVLVEPTPSSDLELDDYYDCIVMDVSTYNDGLTICIEL